MDPRDLDAERFLNLVAFYAAEEYVVEHRPVNEKHQSMRRDLYTKLLGTLRDDYVPPHVAAVVKKTGIQPPAWFHVGDVSIDDARELANAAARRPL